jgi:molybdopterin converting factor small subunit
MRVTVRLFARLRDIVGAGDLARETEAPATIGDIWAGLVAAHPDLAAYSAVVSCARNEDYAKMTTRVDDGDEVAFLPPVSGGGSCQGSTRAGRRP